MVDHREMIVMEYPVRAPEGIHQQQSLGAKKEETPLVFLHLS